MIEFNPKMRKTLGLAVLAATLAGCGKGDDAVPASNGMRGIIDEATQKAADAGALPDGDAPLKEGQSVQGTIQADVGNGTQSFRSLSSKVADNIGEQVDDKLGGRKAQAAIEDANRKLEKLGTNTRVSADDVSDMVRGMAGKTFHDSQVMRVDIIKSLQVTLKGTAGDGGQLDLSLSFNEQTLALTSSNLSYRPKQSAMFDFYQSKNKKKNKNKNKSQDQDQDEDTIQVTVDRFERNADGTYAIAGSFTAKDLPASPMAKKLPSATLPSASGTFSFDALPFREMPKIGGGG